MKVPSEFDPIRPYEPEELPEVYDKLLADEDLSDLLAEKGFAVARRTVTKYRELLGIPKRSERRLVSK